MFIKLQIFRKVAEAYVRIIDGKPQTEKPVFWPSEGLTFLSY